MTRAIELLVICGYDGERKRPDRGWYDLLVSPLKAIAVREPAEDGDGEVWRYRKAVSGGISPAAAASPKSAVEPPIWIDDKVAAGSPALVPLSPSTAHDEATMVRARGIGAGGKIGRA